MIKKNTLILSLSAIASLAILFLHRHSAKPPVFSYQVFHADRGWGYDIRANDSLIIHQATMPVISQWQGFAEAAEAKQAALLVIKKLAQNNLPTLTKLDMEKIIPERNRK